MCDPEEPCPVPETRKKIPCEAEDPKKCKEVKKSIKIKPPDCIEPMPPPVTEKILYDVVINQNENRRERLYGEKTNREHAVGLFFIQTPSPVDQSYVFTSSNDPLVQERIKCLEDCHVQPIYYLLKECDKRVTKKLLYTTETCHEETIDLMEALDKCVKHRAFNRLA